MNPSRRIASLLLTVGAMALGIGGIPLLGGCQDNLFSDSDALTRSRINRYYNRDSALQTSESRKRGTDLGFGMPMGGGSSY